MSEKKENVSLQTKELIISALLCIDCLISDYEKKESEKIFSDLIKEYIDIFKKLPNVGLGLEHDYLLNYKIVDIIFMGNKRFQFVIANIE